MKKNKEQDLLQNLVTHDRKSLQEFYSQNKKQLYSFILLRVENTHDAEEVLQDTFIAFFEGLRDFRGQSSLKTYLFAIAKNKTVDKLRRRKVKKVLFSHLPAYVVEGLSTFLLDDEIDRRQLALKIEQTLSRLSNEYIAILRLKYWEGKKVAEIASILSLSFKATESLLYRARRAFIIEYKKL